MQLALGLWRVLLTAHVGKAAREVLHQFGEFLEFSPAPAFGFAAEAGHALRHVGLKADALLLAVIAAVDAGLFLLRDHMADGLVHFGVELGFVIGLAGFTLDQKFAQALVARQAADVGGDDALTAENHDAGLCC